MEVGVGGSGYRPCYRWQAKTCIYLPASWGGLGGGVQMVDLHSVIGVKPKHLIIIIRNTYIALNPTRLAQSPLQFKTRMDIRINTWNRHTPDDPTPTAKRRQTCTHPGTISATHTSNTWTMDTSHDCKSNTKSNTIIIKYSFACIDCLWGEGGEGGGLGGGGGDLHPIPVYNRFASSFDLLGKSRELCCI